MHSRTSRSLGAALAVFALIAVTSPAQTTKDSKEVKQAFQQGQLDTLVQAQQTLAAAEGAGAAMYAKSIYDDAAERLRFAQANWSSTQKSTHEQTRLRAEEAVWAARAALAKARWLGNNAAIRQLQTDITNFGGTSDALTLSDEQPDLLMMRGTTSATAVDFAQKAIDQAKAVGATAQQNNDLQSAQENLETARKIMKGNSNSESATHLAYVAEMIARRAYYTARAAESNRYLPNLQMERTRLAQVNSDRVAAAERVQREEAQRRANELQQQLAAEQNNRQVQSAELDRLRTQLEESRRASEQRTEQDRAAREAAERALDEAFTRYQTALVSGSSDVDALRRQIEDQQLALRSIQERERVGEQSMEAEIAGLRQDLQNSQQQGSVSAQVLEQRQAELTRRQQELEQMRKDREADLARRADVDRQQQAALTDAQKRRDEAEAQAQQLRQMAAESAQQAQVAQASALSTQAELDRTRQQLASSDAEARRLRMEQALGKLASTRTDTRGLIVTLTNNLLFDTGKTTLKPGAKRTLSRIAEQLSGDNSGVKVEVEGHTDSVGSADSNQALSVRRATAVRDYLLSQGLKSDRISAAGRGEEAPIATNKTAAGRQQNRRVELVIAP
ncbi:MAG: OmpA/MotB domain protein [Acidobacteria bacterium]|nr:OmpA/MotB domain protein [Acidobacteriota bacterium]